MSKKSIIFASDYRGIKLRESLVKYSESLGLDTKDIGIQDGSPLDYVDITKLLINELSNQDALGILICGSGQGVSISANRSNKIRAVLCYSPEDAENARSKLNANVLCLGSKNSTLEESISCFKTFIETSFKYEKHEKSVSKLSANQTEHIYSGINMIVRAVIIHKNHILLTTVTKSNTEFSSDLYFLPGGHVDYRESAINALRREIKEEMTVDVNDVDFIGALECSWDRKGFLYHELNLVYKVDISYLSLENPPVAVDPFHQFVWCPLSEILNYKILPEKLTPMIIEAASYPNTRSIFLSQMLQENAT